VIAPGGVPRPIVDRLNAAINRALGAPAMRQFYASIGDEPAGGTSEEFAALIAADSQKWGEVIKRAGIRLD
jgi:tripartite-type tricarboxylate transporter receptor subunit TctC